MKHKLESCALIAKRNNNKLRYTDDTTFMAESEEELKSLVLKVKEESEKYYSSKWPLIYFLILIVY